MPETDPGIEPGANLTAPPHSFDPSPVSAAQRHIHVCDCHQTNTCNTRWPDCHPQHMRSIGACHDY